MKKDFKKKLAKLKKKKVFVFDWDGTILDTIEKKAENFAEAFCQTLPNCDKVDLRKKVKDSFHQLSGHPRKQIFYEMIAICGNQENTNFYSNFNDMFQCLNKNLSLSAQIFPDALDLLEELIKEKYIIFISSSVPQQELSYLVKAILPMPIYTYISGVFGSEDCHTKGRAHLNTIMQMSGVSTDDMIVFGDDLADHELSTEAGVDCILVDRFGLKDFKDIGKVMNLNVIKNLLL